MQQSVNITKPGTTVQGGSQTFPPNPAARALMVICAYNENVKLENTLRRFPSKSDRDYDVLIVDDGSTDGSIEKINSDEFLVYRMGGCIGVGAAIRKAIELARQWKYDIIMFMAGNENVAKAKVGQMLTDLGFEALDSGDITKARLLEPFGMVWINQALMRGKGRNWAFAAVEG